MFVEQAAADQSERMGCRFHSESPRSTEQPGMPIIGPLLALERLARMQINGHIQFLDLRPERPIFWKIEVVRGIFLPNLRVAVDQCADEAKLLDATLELFDRFVRVLHRQRRERTKTA